MSNVTQLNPLDFPLHGSRLIEASAGTGKTFTIALLYVRLVLGARSANDEAAFERPLTPPEILVVTFTNAATQELRERIRARLVEAAGVFLEGHESNLNLAEASGAAPGGDHLTGMSNVAPRDGFTAPPQELHAKACDHQIHCSWPSATNTIPPPGPPAPDACSSPPNGWTRPPSLPSTAGAIACCASTPSTAAACSRSTWKTTRPSWNSRWCATTGAASTTRSTSTSWPPWCATGVPPSSCTPPCAA